MKRNEDTSQRAREEISALFGEVQGHTATNYFQRGAWSVSPAGSPVPVRTRLALSGSAVGVTRVRA
jgi:hypothetical protein